MRDDPETRFKVTFEYRDGTTKTHTELTANEMIWVGLSQDWKTIKHVELARDEPTEQ